MIGSVLQSDWWFVAGNAALARAEDVVNNNGIGGNARGRALPGNSAEIGGGGARDCAVIVLKIQIEMHTFLSKMQKECRIAPGNDVFLLKDCHSFCKIEVSRAQNTGAGAAGRQLSSRSRQQPSNPRNDWIKRITTGGRGRAAWIGW